jgi:hypothetical protein
LWVLEWGRIFFPAVFTYAAILAMFRSKRSRSRRRAGVGISFRFMAWRAYTARCIIAAMTTPTLVHPGEVDWSGENPGMYLKETPDGPFVTLVSFFRVVASPYGRGHALILLEAPLLHRSLPEALNVCVTDNDPLARYLVSDFAAHFGAFKNAAALSTWTTCPSKA